MIIIVFIFLVHLFSLFGCVLHGYFHALDLRDNHPQCNFNQLWLSCWVCACVFDELNRIRITPASSPNSKSICMCMCVYGIKLVHSLTPDLSRSYCYCIIEFFLSARWNEMNRKKRIRSKQMHENGKCMQKEAASAKKIAHTEMKFIACILIPSVLQILQIVFKHFLASSGRHLKYFSKTNRFVRDASERCTLLFLSNALALNCKGKKARAHKSTHQTNTHEITHFTHFYAQWLLCSTIKRLKFGRHGV